MSDLVHYKVLGVISKLPGMLQHSVTAYMTTFNINLGNVTDADMVNRFVEFLIDTYVPLLRQYGDLRDIRSKEFVRKCIVEKINTTDNQYVKKQLQDMQNYADNILEDNPYERLIVYEKIKRDQYYFFNYLDDVFHIISFKKGIDERIKTLNVPIIKNVEFPDTVDPDLKAFQTIINNVKVGQLIINERYQEMFEISKRLCMNKKHASFIDFIFNSDMHRYS